MCQIKLGDMKNRTILKCEANLHGTRFKTVCLTIPCFQSGGSLIEQIPVVPRWDVAHLKTQMLQKKIRHGFSDARYPFSRQHISGQFLNSVFDLLMKYKFLFPVWDISYKLHFVSPPFLLYVVLEDLESWDRGRWMVFEIIWSPKQLRL